MQVRKKKKNAGKNTNVNQVVIYLATSFMERKSKKHKGRVEKELG